MLFLASVVHHSSGVAGSWAGGCGGDSGGRWAKSGWDYRKIEAESRDFQRSVGDRCVGKVQQLKRWVVVWLKEQQCGQRGEGEASILWR